MKKIIPFVIGAIIIAGGSFYAGMMYGQSKNSNISERAGNFANLTPEQRQAGIQQFGIGFTDGQRGTRANGGLVAGEIISKDDKSITVKLNDGGSKIVFFATSTPVLKNTSGTLQDLNVGEQVSVISTANSDGSVSAQSIQIRPEQPVRQPQPDGQSMQ